MHANSFVRMGLALAVGISGYAGFLPLGHPPGIARAEAKAFYTRKRVNGVWVQGRFAKDSRPARQARAPGRQQFAAAALAVNVMPPARDAGAMEAGPDLAVAREESEADRLSRLQRALVLRAQAIAVAATETTGSTQPVARPEPRSVSFDFESGMKTTVYAGNVLVREAFDPAVSKALASPPPSGAPPKTSDKR